MTEYAQFDKENEQLEIRNFLMMLNSVSGADNESYPAELDEQEIENIIEQATCDSKALSQFKSLAKGFIETFRTK